MAAVGQSLLYQGKYDAAAPFIERAVEIQEQVYGGLGAAVKRQLADLAKTLERDGDITRSRVARLKPGAGRRKRGLHCPEHRRNRRLVEAQAQAVDQR